MSIGNEMTMVNYEIKSQLAKLLATEDLLVENRNVETAQFNVENRVLTLPMWKRASESVYDMLVGHEVGHALYTPNEWGWEDRVPQQFVNVTEDARIEKLMKRRYPGLAKSFYKGYKELSDQDFFELGDKDLVDMNLADRINLYYKIGNFIDVPIDDGEEKDILDIVGKTETFDEAVLAAEVLYKYCIGEVTEQETVKNIPTSENKEGSFDSEPEKEETSGNETPESTGSTESSTEGSSEDRVEEEPQVQTDQAFNEGTQELNGITEQSRNPQYHQVPEVDVEQLIISNAKCHQEIREHWTKISTEETYWDEYAKKYRKTFAVDFTHVDSEYNKFKLSTQKEVNYLVKEFECKKSADAYTRSLTAKTGVLDCTKLHTYKYNEDLFKKINVLPDGKNHGLIFILDWSGSMANTLLSTIKQLFNLIWFCKKVNIPFDVYAFTNNYLEDRSNGYKPRIDWSEITYQEVEDNMLVVSPDFNLLHFLTSDTRKAELDDQMLSLYRIAYSMTFNSMYDAPLNFSLSGTPLNEAIVSLHTIIPKFKMKNNVQKVNTVILTDGEANHLSVFRTCEYMGGKMGVGRLTMGDYIRNRKTGYTYKVPGQYYEFTELLLKDLKESFPDVNLIGIRIASNYDFKPFLRRYMEVSDELMKVIRKEKFYEIKNSGYTSYFGMLDTSLNNDTEFEVDEGASKSKIRSAFAKNLKAKSLNRKVLSQFVDLIS
jgi:hypothetical protein